MMCGQEALDPILTVAAETAAYLKLSLYKMFLIIQRREIRHIQMATSFD